MKCASCGHANRPDQRFCTQCGSRLDRACPACGRAAEGGEKFCGGCGASLAGADAVTATAAPSSATQHLAEKILAGRSALEGERKQVTVLFADVKGSMELAQQLDPEAWTEIMQHFFRILSDGVQKFEGFVDKFTGDGIMALFGAPIAHEDHARRACYAALHLLDGLRGYANELRLRRGLNFSVRIGLNSGEVIVGKISDDLRMDYTAQGHTVGLAARMEQIAEPGKAYLTAHTAALVEGYFALADLGDTHIKGVQEAMHVFELQGLGLMRTRLDVSRSRGFARFVGRGDEMQVLESALERAREGNAQVLGVVGDAGLGKSRLCYEFLERCRSRGIMTYETTGVAHGKAIPFLPVLRLFRAFYGITEQDSAATARERIAGRLLLLDERLRDSLPLNFDFLGVPDPESPAPRIDPEARQRQMFDVVRRVIQARGQKETTVTLLEDLHWFDGGSAAFLEPLIDAAAGTRSLVLLNFRPEYHAPWMGKSYYHQLPLSPLGPDAIRELLGALLGADPSTVGLAEAIHVRTGGNPFFTEEIVQSLIEAGKLQGKKGAYRLVTPVHKLEVPSSVHALLAARIDRLTVRDKDVLQTAAVIGREFDEPTLAAVVEQEAPQLREALQSLKDTEFVYEQSLYPVAEYLFKHPLTQEVALASQLQERRRRLHASVARVIEAAHANDLDQQAALLAHHWEQASAPLEAVRWHRRAAEWTGERDPVEGIRHWRKVRELGHSLEDDESRESRLRACTVILGGGAWRLGMTEDEVLGCMEEVRFLAKTLGRPKAVAAALSGLASHLGVLQGKAKAALDVATEAWDMRDESMSSGERFLIENTRAYWLFVAGRLPDSIEAFDRIIELSGGDVRRGSEVVGYSPLIWSELLVASALAQAGRFGECREYSERSLRRAREDGARETLVWALGLPFGTAYLARGTSSLPFPDIRRMALEAYEIAESVGSQYTQVVATYYLAVALFMSGEYEASEEQFLEALGGRQGGRNVVEWEGYYLAVFADSYLARGDTDRAFERATQAIGIADSGGAWFFSAVGRTVLAEVLLQSGAPELEIRELIAAARELVGKSGGNSLLPRLRETEARLAGRHDRAILEAGLREAEALYRAMGTPDPADRLIEELSALS